MSKDKLTQHQKDRRKYKNLVKQVGKSQNNNRLKGGIARDFLKKNEAPLEGQNII